MGIQPIDLQTMFSQLSNVSKTMSGPQQAQLTEAMQQHGNIQKNLEKAKTVKETSNQQSTAGGINRNGSNNSSFLFNKNKQQKKDDDEDLEPEQSGGTNNLPYLGNLIDITS